MKLGRLRLVLLWAAAAVALLLALSMAVEMLIERSRLEESARREARTIAVSLAEETRQTIASIDMALRIVANTTALSETGGGLATEGLTPLLHGLRENLPFTENLLVADRRGRIVASTLPLDGTSLDLSDRAYFREQADDPDAGLYLGHPIRGRLTGDFILPVSRRISAPDGRFAGVVLATLGPDYFDNVYGRLNVGPDSAFLLADLDGMVVARHPQNASVGTSFADRPLFATHLPDAEEGSYLSPAQSDGEVRITGYRKIDPYDLVVAVAIHYRTLMAPWRREVVRHLILYLVLVATFGLALNHVLRLIRAQEKLQDSQTRSTAQLIRRAAQQQSLAFLSQVGTDVETARDFLLHAAEQATTALDAAGCEILQYDPGRGRVTRVAGWGSLGPAPGESAAWDRQLQALPGFPGASLLTARDDPGAPGQRPSERPVAAGRLSGMAVPLRRAGEPFAALVVHGHAGQAFEAEDLRYLETVSHTLSVLLERQREIRLREVVLDSLSANICVVDGTGHIILVNGSWIRFARENGHPHPEAWRSTSYLEVCSAAEGEEAAAPMRKGLQAVLNGEADGFEMEYPCETPARSRWFRAIVVPLSFDNDRGAVVMHLDITEQRAAEKQLREVQRMEAVGQLTGGVAHDFNNLLTVIVANLDMLIEDIPPDTQQGRMLGIMQKAADRAGELTDRLLSYSRRQHLEPQAIDVAEMLNDFRDLLRRVLREDIAVEVDLAPGLPCIRADPGQLQTALLNLVINARDAMPDGGRIRLSARSAKVAAGPAEATDLRIILAVTDNGSGMPEEVRRRAFEPFYTTKPVGKGTGLGLSMVYGFARQSGGFVAIDSVPGEGTAVELHLPATQSGLPADRAAPGGTLLAGDARRVLLVEDEALVRSSVAASLERMGFVVETAASGEQAIERLTGGLQPDLVLTDVIMPGGTSGYDVAMLVRRRAPKVPVALMSGYASPDLLENMQGFDPTIPLLRKPFGPQALADLLSNLGARAAGKE